MFENKILDLPIWKCILKSEEYNWRIDLLIKKNKTKISDILIFTLKLENINLNIKQLNNYIIKLDEKILAYYQYKQYNKKSVLLDKFITSNLNYWDNQTTNQEESMNPILDSLWIELDKERYENLWSSVLFTFLKDMKENNFTNIHIYSYESSSNFYIKTLNLFINEWFIKNYEIDNNWLFIKIFI